jgi:von Willebrand factor type A domain-containing protein
MQWNERNSNSSHRVAFWSISIVTAFMLCTAVAGAQFRLIISRPLLDEYPIVKIPLQVKDNASKIEDLKLSYFTLTENGVPRQLLYLDCQVDTAWEPVTFLLVLDVSYSMRHAFGSNTPDPFRVKWKAAKAAFVAAVNAMRDTDGAVLYSLSNTTNREWPYTKSKIDLRYAIENQDFRPGTFIFDTIINVLNDAPGLPGRLVMILLTDGSDQGSFYNEQDAIDLALEMTIPIFVIGLDVEVADEVVLRKIAFETGGDYYYAPSEEELAIVMNNISESIFSSRCILAYETDDTCRNGNTRVVDIIANIPPYQGSAQTSYTLANELERPTISVGIPGTTYSDEQRHAIPVFSTGLLKSSEALTISFEVFYDPALLSYAGLDPAQSIVDLSAISVDASVPGRVAVSGTSVSLYEDIAVLESKALLYLLFDVFHQDQLVQSQIRVENSAVSQHCPAITSNETVAFTIEGCTATIELAFDSDIVLFAGRETQIPLIVSSPIDLQQELEYRISVDYNPDMISFLRFEIDGTISENMNVQITETVKGSLLINGLRGNPALVSGELIRLIFMGEHWTESQQVLFRIKDPSFAQSCIPQVDFAGDGVLLNGLCEKVVRKRDVFLGQNSPNPIVAGGGSATIIPYTVSGKNRVTLEVYNLDGVLVETLFDGFPEKGSYHARFSPKDLPSGVYVYVLKDANEVLSKKMVLD